MGSRKLRVAYIVTAYKYPDQIVRLVRRLAVPGTAFVIHIDRKSNPSVQRAVKEGLAEVADCHFLKPQRVYWGHFSILEVALRGLRALDDLSLDPDHTVMLSGQDYPIKEPGAIAERLSADSELAYIEHSALPNLEWWPNERGGLDRIERYGLRLPRRGMVKTPLRRRIPNGWQPFGGSSTCMLGRPHREHLVGLMGKDRRAVEFFRHATVPEEIFFQTVLMNSPLSDSVVNDNLLYVRWKPPASHPELLRVPDVEELITGPSLIARKFDSEHDPAVLDEIDRRLGMAPQSHGT